MDTIAFVFQLIFMTILRMFPVALSTALLPK